jgi:hypothetical protein
MDIVVMVVVQDEMFLFELNELILVYVLIILPTLD